VCDEILFVANDAPRSPLPEVRVVPDEMPNTGSLGGLYSGLNAAGNELALAVACDMPFLNPALLRFLITLSSGYDVIIPSVHNAQKPERPGIGQDTAKRLDLHPLHALYRKTCLAPMREAIGRNDLRMISFYEGLRVKIVEQGEIERFDPEHLSFWNVNTPEELNRAQEFAARKNQGEKHDPTNWSS
jgi:molybdopterin-guanine dinucleotide biosynthesis protein A